MRKTSGNKVSVEAWNVRDNDKADARKTVAKVAVRDSKGRFLPATNYRGSVVG